METDQVSIVVLLLRTITIDIICLEGEWKSGMDVSIIIPLYKGRKFCDGLLDMLEKNSLYDNLFSECKIEVVFVNDFPGEKVIIKKEVWHFDITVIEQERNVGIQASRVNGIRHSQGEYVIMLDQDDLITENWIYSQWHHIKGEKVNYCVCNGWSGRFRILWESNSFRNEVNNLNYFLTIGNAIYSPGQVIIRRKNIPQDWLLNIQSCNGADDYLLWIMVLKNGERFLINEENLYYHTPERSPDSIDSIKMIKSLKEASHILDTIGYLDKDERDILNRQIERREYLYGGKKRRIIREKSVEEWEWFGKYIKFQKMFHVMFDWLCIINRGIKIIEFFEKNNFHSIAIYGMGYIGECLYNELEGTNVKVKYGIDRTAIDFRNELAIYRLEDNLEKVDVVVVTVMDNTTNVIDKLERKVGFPIVTIFEVLLFFSVHIH